MVKKNHIMRISEIQFDICSAKTICVFISEKLCVCIDNWNVVKMVHAILSIYLNVDVHKFR